MRVICVPIRLIGLDGDCVEITEFAPWPERAGLWEAEEHIDHDGARYRYAGCDQAVYVYREQRRTATMRRAETGDARGSFRSA